MGDGAHGRPRNATRPGHLGCVHDRHLEARFGADAHVRRRRRDPARAEGAAHRDLARPRGAGRERFHPRAGVPVVAGADPGRDVQEPAPAATGERRPAGVRRGLAVVYPWEAPVPPRGLNERVEKEQVADMALTKERPEEDVRVAKARRPGWLGGPLVLALAIAFLLVAFGWTYLQDPSISAPTRDPAWYTWRSNVIMND